MADSFWLPESIAKHVPLSRAISSYYLRHDVICLHTMVGTLPGSWSWSNRVGGTYWALGTSGLGECWQCHSLRFRSAANLYGNPYVIPIENADMGPGFASWSGRCGDVPAFTSAQVDKLVQVVAWLCARFNIPPVFIPDTQLGRRGIAYHRQGINPWRHPNGVLWSNSTGKCCPDDRRIHQLVNIIIPRVQTVLKKPAPTKDWFDMATEADLTAAVAKALDSQAKRVFGITSWEAYMEALIDAARKGSRTGVSDERLHQAANDALRAVLDFEAGAKQGPLHEIVRQVLAEDDTPAPPS